MKSFKSTATREEENHAHGKTPAATRPGPSLLREGSHASHYDDNRRIDILASQLTLLMNSLMLHSRLAYAVSCGRILQNASLKPIRRSWAIRPSLSKYNARSFSSNQVLCANETDKLLSEFKENCKKNENNILIPH